ncbi:hypothetical protein BST85_04350 [Aureitalea marina]|uniref:TonB-dependent receptor plug domain-containing protein n=2 Tax=Aureitalea marina TaxID=930804 RepID=A0A2S7KNQ5_9FLAO|nr:hypothetical protein BST85_04350 [Aureitalea marina]
MWLSLFLFFLLPTLHSQNSNTGIKQVYGVIQTENEPLSEVNIRVEGTSRGTQTDENGRYSMEVRNGEVLQFSHIGYRTFFVIVEDVTEELNLEMFPVSNELGEVIINADVRKPQNSVSSIIEEEVLNVDLPMPTGTLNPYKSGFATGYIPGRLVQNGLPLIETLNGKVASLRVIKNQIFIRDLPVRVLVDGLPSPILPDSQLLVDGLPSPILPDSQLVEDIFVFRNTRTVYIRTIANLSIAQQKRDRANERIKNQNFYQDDAVRADSDMQSTNSASNPVAVVSGPLRKIKGEISFAESPMPEVNVTVENTNRGTTTNAKGRYQIKARTGEVLVFSYVGFKAVRLIVEDVTSELSFEMIANENVLDEVVVKAKSRDGERSSYTKKAEREFYTSMGRFDPKKAGYNSGYIDGDDLNPASVNLLDFMAGKVAGLTVNPITGEVVIRGGTGSIEANTPPLWEVDGVVLTQIPPLDVANIKDIRVLKSISSLTRYGPQSAGGVIVIQTRSGNFEAKDGAAVLNTDLANSNFYNNDALANSEFARALENVSELRTQLQSENNPERLKAIAYQFEALDMNFDAIEAYKKVFGLRPRYAQSYRDLAQAYVQAEQFKPAWRMYMGYINQGYPTGLEGIGELVYDEMEWLYFRRKNQTQIKEVFQTQSEDLMDFQTDVRFVFEWNTSEAEFDLEFVSPDRRAYVFEHTLEANQLLINTEKRTGFSSKRFFIEDIMEGDWLINLSYKGNKKSAPTYFKMTAYYNWGKVDETKVVQVYKLNPSDDQKIQLLKINRQTLLASR